MLDRRVNKIKDLLFEIACGNYDKRGEISEKKDEFDAIITGINMLAEELEQTTISRNYLKKIYEGVTDMVFVLDKNGYIEDINQRVTEIARYQLKNLKSKPVNSLFPFKHKFNFAELKKQLTKNHIKTDIRTDFITAYNAKIPVNCSFSLIDGSNHEDCLIILLIKDLSELVSTEKELLDRNKELNTFIYRASHDLKGPLASMMGLLNLIDINPNQLEDIPNYIENIKKSAIKLNSVVSDLLDLGRITANLIEFEDLMIDQIFNQIIEEYKYMPLFSEASINIINSQDYPLHSVPQIVKSILQNILDNSLKYAQPNASPNIEIKIMDSNNGVKLEIKDYGIGIPTNIQKKIYNMFYRGNHMSKGSGLGLYIVKTGVEKLGGRIWLKSKPGKGSTFSIYLPNKLKKPITDQQSEKINLQKQLNL